MIDRHIYMTNAALDKLPLFAKDLDIAIAVVGKENASHWKRHVLPALERTRGFPRFDPLHQGRPVFLVKLFYASYYHPEFDSVRYLASEARDKEDREEIDRKWEEYRQKKLDRKANAKARSEAWAEKKRKAFEEFRAKKAAEASNKIDNQPDSLSVKEGDKTTGQSE